MAQINITRGGILAAAGFSLWFDTNLRANIIHLNNLPIHIPPAVLLNNLTTTTNIHNTEHHRFDNRRDILQANNNNTSWFPSDRIALILSTKHWQHSGKVLNTSSSPRKHIKLFENASSDTKRRTGHSRESAIFQLNYALG